MQILPSLDWHKSRNVSRSCNFVVSFLADGRTNVVTRRARNESERPDSCVCDRFLWQSWKGILKSISSYNFETSYEIEGTAGWASDSSIFRLKQTFFVESSLVRRHKFSIGLLALVYFYGLSILVSYLMTNPVFTYKEHTISFQTFFVWTLLLIVHTWNYSPLQSILLWVQCTCCTFPTTSGRPHRSPLVWACQWPSSQPLSSPLSLGNNQTI